MAPVMASWKEGQLKRLEAYRELRYSDEYAEVVRGPGGAWAAYAWLSRKGYDSKHLAANYNNGKVWWDEFLDKEIKNKMLKIDVAVHKKVKDFDAVQINQLMAYASSKDGFVEGAWKFIDAEGQSRVLRIETIYAGGYNVQCFHVRTLIKFK